MEYPYEEYRKNLIVEELRNGINQMFCRLEDNNQNNVLTMDQINECRQSVEKISNLDYDFYALCFYRLEDLIENYQCQESFCEVCNKIVKNKGHLNSKKHKAALKMANFNDKVVNAKSIDQLGELWNNIEDIFEQASVNSSQSSDNSSEFEYIPSDEEEEEEFRFLDEDPVPQDDVINNFLIHPELVLQTIPNFEVTKEGVKHTDALTRTYFTLFSQHHGKPFSFELLSTLLQIATHAHLSNLQDKCADSVYYLQKSRSYFSPRFEQQTKQLSTGKV